MDIPRTKKEKNVDLINGIEVSDPYRWLENSEDIEVLEWIKNQNKYTNSFLRNEVYEKFSEELVQNFKATSFSNPYPVNGKYFYTERRINEDQSVLFVKNGIHGEPIKLIDPNTMEGDNVTSIQTWQPSFSGNYLVYGLSEGGDEMSTLYIVDVDKKNILLDKIINCRYSSISWLPDDSGFFYTRNPRPNTVPKDEESMHTKVYFHKIGDDPNIDELIFGKDRPKDDMIVFSLSLDAKYLGIGVSCRFTENEIYIYNTQTNETRALIIGIPALFSLYFLRDKILLFTNYKANNFRVLWSTYDNLYKPLDEWGEFIQEREFLLESLYITKGKIFAEYLVNAYSEVSVLDYEGKEIEKIPLPEYSSFTGISGRRSEEEFFYGVTSFLFPKISYRYDPKTDEYSVYRRTENPINPDDYKVNQEWYTSKDGTKIPMFIYHKNDIKLNGLNPTVLYGYGGFATNLTPSFSKSWAPWQENGGVFVIANIRGGGEFGEKWHEGGILDKKQNSFDDFIAAGEYLIQRGYTSKEHLGALGGSNGGLLVSAVAVQRPDLFKAVCAQVPLTDMVRFPLFGMASRWVHEYGNPNNKEELENILKWSPYHNIKEGKEYPNFLFITGENDSRVNPLHSRKMVAILQSVNKINPVFLFTEEKVGHGPGRPIKKEVESNALQLNFFASNLELKFK